MEGRRLKLAVAGTGYVGLVAGACFAEVGHHVVCVDIDADKIAVMNAGLAPIHEAGLQEIMVRNHALGRLDYTTDYRSAYEDVDAVFIGVGTPEQPDGSANLQHIATVARQIAETVTRDCLVVVKSTVPVGTNDLVEQFIRDFLPRPGDTSMEGSSTSRLSLRVEVASNPEFLAQGTAVRDTLHAPRIVVGTESIWAEGMLREIYRPFEIPIVSVSRRSAEMIKYASNDFLALKISYMNDIANLCERVGADIQDVANGMSFDERIGSEFLSAGIGYGGSCFPKDTKALVYLANQNGYDLRTVRAAVDVNSEQKTLLFKKASRRLITFDGLKVAVLGLTFKPRTDDLREAPSLVNVPLLLEQGANVCGYDPAGVENFRRLFPEGNRSRGSVCYASTVSEALEGANACFILTEWDEISRVDPWVYRELMRTPLVYDGRNIYDARAMKEAGVEYYSIGRPSTRDLIHFDLEGAER